jgi:hypothetical protein
MTDPLANRMSADTSAASQFEDVLDQLRVLLSRIQSIGIDVVLVGGQVLSVEARAAGGDGVIEVRTATEVVVSRGYSMEPDLLFDVDAAPQRVDAIGDVLTSCGFVRVKTHRWRKESARGEVLLDLFIAADVDDANNPGGYTRLPAGDLALLRAKPIRIALASGNLDIAVPDPVGFLAMKIVAKQRLRPTATKDSFDIYAYVSMKGTTVVALALKQDAREGPCPGSC